MLDKAFSRCDIQIFNAAQKRYCWIPKIEHIYEELVAFRAGAIRSVWNTYGADIREENSELDFTLQRAL